MLLFDIITDMFQSAVRPTTILVSSGWPVTIERDYYFVHSPFLSTARDYTCDFHEVARGHQSHGLTGLKVKRPYIGQNLFFKLENGRVFSTRQTITRVYNNDSLGGLPTSYFSQFLKLDQSLRITDIILLPEIADPSSSRNLIISLIITECLVQGSWTINCSKTTKRLQVFFEDPILDASLIDLNYAGIIRVNTDSITIKSPGKILLMEALYHRFNLRTEIDKDGILQFV